MSSKGAGTETFDHRRSGELAWGKTWLLKDRTKLEPCDWGVAMTARCLDRDAIWNTNRPLLSKMQEMGVTVTEEEMVFGFNRISASSVQ